MGMFDSVIFKCPNCGEDIDFQSKAGECSLDEFPSNEVPVEIASDVEGDIVECSNCKKYFEAYAPGMQRFVEMHLWEKP